MKYLIHIILILSIFQFDNIIKGERPNSLRMGVAEVKVRIDVISESGEKIDLSKRHFEWLDDMIIMVSTMPLFSTDFDNLNSVALTRKNGEFSGKIPVNRILEVGGIMCLSKTVHFSGIEVMLSQAKPVEMTLELTESGNIRNTPAIKDATDTSIAQWLVINEIMQQAVHYTPPHMWNSATHYSEGWKKVRKEEENVIYPQFIKTSLDRKETKRLAEVSTSILSGKMRQFVKNNLNIVFAIDETLLYVRRAERSLVKKITPPPMEAYGFLNEIDYNPDIFLINFMELPMGMFYKEILNIPGSGIESIGEKPVKEWQKEVRKILAPAIKEPTKLLMDLLAGMSYVLQIETGEPLSEKQIKNINKGFTDDIGKIVLSYNTKLAEEAKKQ